MLANKRSSNRRNISKGQIHKKMKKRKGELVRPVEKEKTKQQRKVPRQKECAS